MLKHKDRGPRRAMSRCKGCDRSETARGLSRAKIFDRPNLSAHPGRLNTCRVAAAAHGAHRDHRMDKNAAPNALADPRLREDKPHPDRLAAPALCGSSVRSCPPPSRGQALDRKHMPASDHRLGRTAPAIDQAFGRHLIVGQKATEANFPRSTAFTQLAQTYVLTRNHAFEKHRPPLSKRRSRKWPSDRLSSDMATPRSDSKCRARNHSSASGRHRKSSQSQSDAQRCVHPRLRGDRLLLENPLSRFALASQR